MRISDWSSDVCSSDLEQFRTDIRSNLERELKGALMNRLRRAVGEELVAAYKDVEMPPKLVENEARSMLQQAVEQARRQGQKDEVPENGHSSEEHTSEFQSIMRTAYAVLCS